jgi:hypothetical protein
MLIIAVGFGDRGEPFTCSVKATSDQLDKTNIDSVLPYICNEQKLDPIYIDELLIVDNDEVIKTFNYEDGLGRCQECLMPGVCGCDKFEDQPETD